MDQSLLDGIAQSGTLGLLLGASLYWFARLHLPERDRLQRELLERLARGHEDALARLAASFDALGAQLGAAQQAAAAAAREAALRQEGALDRLREALEQNTRSVAQNSQAVLAVSFARRRSGLSSDEAEALLRRVSAPDSAGRGRAPL